MRTYYIYHWYNPDSKPVPEAYMDNSVGWVVDVDDIHAFAEKYGPIQLRPPTEKFSYWQIYVTDGGSFKQK
jgi:hypothetical protein